MTYHEEFTMLYITWLIEMSSPLTRRSGWLIILLHHLTLITLLDQTII